MGNTFSCEFTVGWGDMDFNGHMRNTAYLICAIAPLPFHPAPVLDHLIRFFQLFNHR